MFIHPYVDLFVIFCSNFLYIRIKIRTTKSKENNKNQVIAIYTVNEPKVKICTPNKLRNWIVVLGNIKLNTADNPNTVAAHRYIYDKK